MDRILKVFPHAAVSVDEREVSINDPMDRILKDFVFGARVDRAERFNQRSDG